MSIEELKEFEMAIRASHHGRYPVYWHGQMLRLIESPTYTFVSEDWVEVDARFDLWPNSESR